jgi:hypothetical protein
MNKRILFALVLMVAVCGLWSCGGDDDNDGCSTAWASELTNEINAMSAAATTYALNPTVANCNAYKDAAQDYIDALEPYGNCATLTGQNRTDWQNALNDAQAEINQIDCSGK